MSNQKLSQTLLEMKKRIEDINLGVQELGEEKKQLRQQLKQSCFHPEEYLKFKIGWHASAENASIGCDQPTMPSRRCELCETEETGIISSKILEEWDHSWIPDSLASYRELQGKASSADKDDLFASSREEAAKDFLRCDFH